MKPLQLQHIRPTTEDYRQGKPVVENDFMKDSSTATFPFRGVQFGNWTNQNDRQENLNMSFDAFKDLAKALHIHDEDVTLGGQLQLHMVQEVTAEQLLITNQQKMLSTSQNERCWLSGT